METQNNYEFQITNYAHSAKHKPTPNPSQEGKQHGITSNIITPRIPLLGGARGGFLIALLIFCVSHLISATTATAQNNVGIGTTTPNSKAILELQATDKGLLTPRLTQVQMLAIPTPPNGLLVYNTTKNCFYYFDNVTNTWKDMCSIGATGKDTLVLNLVQIDSLFAHLIKTDTLLSNTIITNYLKADSAYIKNLVSQYIKTDSIKAGFGRFDSIYVNGQNITDYINSQLTNTLATKDTVVLKYLRTDSIYSILIKADSAFIKSILTNTLTATYITTDSLYAHFGKFDSLQIGGKNISAIISDSIASQAWLLKGNNASASNKLGTLNAQDLKIVANNVEAIRIANGSSNVGIGQPLPSAKLDVAGDIKFDQDLRPAGLSGNAGDILTSAGAGVAPTWTNPSTIVPTTTNTLTNAINTINSTVNGVSATAPAVNTVSNTLTGTNITTTVNGVAGTPLDLSSIIPASNNWNLLGNAGTTAGTNFLGTTDAQDVVFKRNNAQAGLLGANNTSFGVNALNPLSTGNGNVALGSNSLFNNTTGYNNVGVGNNTLNATTTGFHNVALGLNAMQANTTGAKNIALGYAALNQNISGDDNIAIGVQSLFANIGANNVSIGSFNMESNTSGTENTSMGSFGLRANTIGSQNVSVGTMAMLNNTTGTNNNALGYQAILTNTTGTDNNAMGYQALYSNTSGYFNNAIGTGSLYNNTTGYVNVANGYNSMYANTTGFANTANGSNSLKNNTTGYNLTATGQQALAANTTGVGNTATGSNSLSANTTASFNTATGWNSMYTNTIGTENTATGFNSLYKNTIGLQNTSTGANSLFSNTVGNFNTANGHASMFNNTTGNDNSAYGNQSLQNNTTASDNTAIGVYSLISTTTGTGNTAVGSNVAYGNITGSYNTVQGYFSLYNNTTGSGNTVIGSGAGIANTTGDNNTVIGNNADVVSNNLTNATAIGYNAKVGASNSLVLGNTVNVGINTTVPANKLEITHGTAGNSGLRLTNLTNAGVLSTNASGDVVNNSTPNAANGLFWGLTGNNGTLPATNFIGTTDAQDFVTRTNNTEKMRVTSAGNVGINNNAPTDKLNVNSANNTFNAITASHTSASVASAYHAVRGDVTNGAYTNAIGYLGYHNSANATYGMYATGGNYAGVLLNKTYIGNLQPTTAINTADLEVSNVTAGTAAANLTLRQSTALTVASTDMGYLNFGDNTLAAPQASIRASRDLAGGAGDLPTRLTFHTTPDASTTLTERMRITENGNVGINVANPLSKLHVFNAGNADIRSVAEGGYSGIQAWAYGAGGHPYFIGFAGRGTQLLPTYPLAGDVLSAYIGRDVIDGNSANYGGASIYMRATENYSATNKGTNINFSTTPNGANNYLERMRIAENGNVGINHSNPAYKLTVVNTDPSIAITTLSTMNPIISAANASNFHASWSEVTLGQTNNFTGTQYGAVNRINVLLAQTGSVGGIIGSTNDATHAGTGTVTTAMGGEFYVATIGAGTITNGYGVHISSVSGTNKWSLFASDATAPSYFAGAVGIGTTTPTEKLTVIADGADGITLKSSGVDAGDIIFREASNFEKSRIYTSGVGGVTGLIISTDLNVIGNATINGTFYASDIRYKNNIKNLDGVLSKLTLLRGVSYDYNLKYKAKRGFNNSKQLGVIAQEVEVLFPELVTTDIDGFKAVDYAKFAPVFIEAIKEINTSTSNNNTELKSIIEKQQIQIDELKKAIELLQKK